MATRKIFVYIIVNMAPMLTTTLRSMPRSSGASWLIQQQQRVESFHRRKRDVEQLKDNTPMSVYLPNGARTTETMGGRVVLSMEMELTDVLYVPNLTYNLISIRQLISMLNCQIMFTNELCTIHDRTSKMLIRGGELRGGVGSSGTRLVNHTCR